jgi:hypothetical protein
MGIIIQHDASPPDQRLLLNKAVHLDGEASQDAFTHKFVLVTQVEVFRLIPAVGGLVGGDRVRGE